MMCLRGAVGKVPRNPVDFPYPNMAHGRFGGTVLITWRKETRQAEI
jgi:hypothetical protein